MNSSINLVKFQQEFEELTSKIKAKVHKENKNKIFIIETLHPIENTLQTSITNSRNGLEIYSNKDAKKLYINKYIIKGYTVNSYDFDRTLVKKYELIIDDIGLFKWKSENNIYTNEEIADYYYELLLSIYLHRDNI